MFCIIQCIMHHTQSSCIRSWHSAGRSCLLLASRRTLMQLENHQNQKILKKKNTHRKKEHGWVVEELHCMQQNRTLLFPVLQWGVSYQDGPARTSNTRLSLAKWINRENAFSESVSLRRITNFTIIDRERDPMHDCTGNKVKTVK